MTKVQARKALTEWNKTISTSTFWTGFSRKVEDKAVDFAKAAIVYKGENRLEKICEYSGRYEAFKLDLPQLVKNYIKELEKEAGQS